MTPPTFLKVFTELIFFKAQCVLCDSEVYEKTSICDACRIHLPVAEYACKVCALPLENDVKSKICGQCISEMPYVDYAVNLFHYAAPVDYLISQMKFHQQLSVAAVLANLLKHHIESNELEYGFPDALIPVPLFKKRLASRGFNQSLEIIKPLAKSQNIPILLNVIERSKNTAVQTNLSKQSRIKNVLGCFSLLKKPKESHIVIVDDVVTTGATTNALAKLLKESGVEKVGVWSLARADLK